MKKIFKPFIDNLVVIIIFMGFIYYIVINCLSLLNINPVDIINTNLFFKDIIWILSLPLFLAWFLVFINRNFSFKMLLYDITKLWDKRLPGWINIIGVVFIINLLFTFLFFIKDAERGNFNTIEENIFAWRIGSSFALAFYFYLTRNIFLKK